jgi:hypothetical protein
MTSLAESAGWQTIEERMMPSTADGKRASHTPSEATTTANDSAAGSLYVRAKGFGSMK